MTTHVGQPAVRDGTHTEFAALYESYLDAVYRCRQTLVNQIAKEINSRGARSVLDCAAGTGFPALDLTAQGLVDGVRIHCTDADPEMLRILQTRLAQYKNINIRQFSAPQGLTLGDGAIGALRLGWHELGEITRKYDYVMCRGNSLAYGNSWRGGNTVSSPDAIFEYLKRMTDKVRSGGFFHVDAPWRPKPACGSYETKTAPVTTVLEQVSMTDSHRQWQVQFERPQGDVVRFERFSTQLTIHKVADMLNKLGFENTEPFAFYGERLGFGVIIAVKRF